MAKRHWVFGASKQASLTASAKPAKLIEHVGQRIVSRVYKEEPRVQKIKLELVKIAPPINGDVASVSIVIEEERT